MRAGLAADRLDHHTGNAAFILIIFEGLFQCFEIIRRHIDDVGKAFRGNAFGFEIAGPGNMN